MKAYYSIPRTGDHSTILGLSYIYSHRLHHDLFHNSSQEFLSNLALRFTESQISVFKLNCDYDNYLYEEVQRLYAGGMSGERGLHMCICCREYCCKYAPQVNVESMCIVG